MAKCENCYHAEICKNYPNTGLPPKMRQELIHKGCEYYINNSDVQEVVRCRDCKYLKYDRDFITGRYCSLRNVNGGKYCNDDDFCSYGEKRR